ncbi:MAG: hypothetical protein ACKO2V_05165 [Snowella sp.]
MNWIPYLLLTIAAYYINLTKLKARTEQEKIGSTPVLFNTLIFFAIFEFFFLESILKIPLFHVFGLCVSFALALSIYWHLKNLKKDVESIFNKLMQQGQGRVSILTFMQRTELSQDQATAFLEAKIQKFQGTTYETLGNIYYEFDRW